MRWYGHMLRRDDGHVLKVVLVIEVEGQRRNEGKERKWMRQFEKKASWLFLAGKCTLPINVDCWC